MSDKRLYELATFSLLPHEQASGTVGWELPLKRFTLDKSSEFDRDRFAFVAGLCIRGKPARK
jgi:hypothetical protein